MNDTAIESPSNNLPEVFSTFFESAFGTKYLLYVYVFLVQVDSIPCVSPFWRFEGESLIKIRVQRAYAWQNAPKKVYRPGWMLYILRGCACCVSRMNQDGGKYLDKYGVWLVGWKLKPIGMGRTR